MRRLTEVASLRKLVQILIIEDDREIRNLLHQVLSDEGHELLIVERPEHAAPDASPDLVITDLVDVHGYASEIARESIDRVQQRFPGAPIIVCTAYEQAIEELDRLGAAAVLPKPFTIERLLETVARFASH